jgi:hypothetical protein
MAEPLGDDELDELCVVVVDCDEVDLLLLLHAAAMTTMVATTAATRNG